MENILRIMNNLLSFSQPKQNSDSAKPTDGAPNNYSLLPKRMTIVYIKDRSPVIGAHRSLAADYSFEIDDLLVFCNTNARVARRHFRYDHERIFYVLTALLKGLETPSKRSQIFNTSNHLGLRHTSLVIDALYVPVFYPATYSPLTYSGSHAKLLESKDVQLLAMFAVVVLQLDMRYSHTLKGRVHDHAFSNTLLSKLLRFRAGRQKKTWCTMSTWFSFFGLFWFENTNSLSNILSGIQASSLSFSDIPSNSCHESELGLFLVISRIVVESFQQRNRSAPNGSISRTKSEQTITHRVRVDVVTPNIKWLNLQSTRKTPIASSSTEQRGKRIIFSHDGGSALKRSHVQPRQA